MFFINKMYLCSNPFTGVSLTLSFEEASVYQYIISEYSKSAKNSDSNAAAAFMKLLDIINKDSYALGIHNIFENEKSIVYDIAL